MTFILSHVKLLWWRTTPSPRIIAPSSRPGTKLVSQASDEAKRKFDKELEYEKNNRMDRACELWGEGAGLSPDAPSILYDKGICAEIGGKLDRSLEL